VKQSGGKWTCQQRQDVLGSGGFAEDRHAVRIPAEGGNVLPHPAQRRDEVECPEIARSLFWRRLISLDQRGVTEPAEHAQAIVQAHDDDAVMRGVVARYVVGGRCAGTRG